MYSKLVFEMTPLLKKIVLNNIYPNPFNPTATIQFSFPESQRVCLRVFDVTGKEIAKLINAQMPVGDHRVQWHAGNISSEVYYVWIETEKYQARQKCLLLK